MTPPLAAADWLLISTAANGLLVTALLVVGWRCRRVRYAGPSNAFQGGAQLADARFRVFAESMPQIVWIHDSQGAPIYLNHRWRAYTGLTANVGRQALLEVVHPDDREACLSDWRRAVETGREFEREIRLRRHDGAYRWHLSRSAPDRDPQSGKILEWIGTSTDIEDRKSNEIRLQRKIVENSDQLAQARLELDRANELRTRVLDGLSSMVYEFRIEPGGRASCPFVSAAVRDIYGVSPREVSRGVQLLFDAIHPEDRARVDASIAASAAALSHWTCEYRIKLRDGAVKWLRGSSHPLREADGTVVWFGFVIDISEEKRIRAELEESEERFRQSFEYAGIGMALVGLDGRWLRVNRALCQIVGYSREELYTKRFQDLTHPDDIGKDLEAVQSLIRGETTHYLMEKRYFHREGHLVWIRLTASLVRNQAGAGIHFVSQIEDVTERRRAQEALAESRTAFQRLFEGAPDAQILVDRNGAIMGVNPRAESLFGYEPGGLAGANLQDLVPERFRRRHVGHLGNFFAHASRRPMGTGIELFSIRRDGTEFPVDVMLSPIDRDGDMCVLAVIRDVTDRRRAELELRESKERFRLMVDNVLDYAIYALDESGRVSSWNAGAQRVKGYEAEEVLGRPFADFDYPEQSLSGAELLRRAAETGDGMLEGWRRRRNGSRFWATVSVTAQRDAGGRTLGYTVVTHDISDRKALEDQLRERNLELQSESSRAQEASRLKSEILANLSHELRTPLNGIIGFSTFLLGEKPGPLNDTQKAHLQDVSASGRHLLRLINDLLDLAKIESGRVDVAAETFALREVLDEVAGVLRPMIGDKHLDFSVNLSTADDRVTLDPQKIRQILYNLLSNAIKFTPERGAIAMTLADAGLDEIEFAVVDSGIGIREQDFPRLFVEFQQLDSGLSRRFPGSGLGLALTRKLVQLQGGTIRVDSTPGRGTTFTVRLPRHLTAPAP